MMPIRRLSLTDFKSNIVRGAREKTLKLAMSKDDIMNKWKASSWGKKLQAQDTRAQMNDFDRFKLMVARKKRSIAVKKALKPKKK